MVLNEKYKKLIIFTHGNLAVELLNLANLLLGEIDPGVISVISNNGLSTIQAINQLLGIIKKDCTYIIITDFPGGSCYIASRKVSAQLDNVFTLTGANISMLISFLTKCENCSIQELLEIMRTDARRAII